MASTVQGFLATISIDGNDISASVEGYGLSETRNTLKKPTMNGSPDSKTIVGSRTGALSVDGLIDQANMNLLEVSWAKDVEVPFSIGPLEAGVTTNTLWAGNIIMGDFERSLVADDLWRFSLTGETSGAITHTPFAP